MAKELSHIAAQVRASTTIAIDTKYKEMKAAGLDVIGFGAGEPDFDTPDNIKMEAIKAISANFTRYTPAAGTVELRKAVANRLEKDCGVSYEPSQIIVSNGAKQSIFLTLTALVNPGDEVILAAPYWVSYYELVRMVGGVPVIVDTANSGWKMTADQLRAAITPKTKAFMLNNPSNPSGVVYSTSELSDLVRVCVENDIYIIADEIYYKLVYGDAKFTSVASLGEDVKKLTILINGVSKSYAMTGWRIGYAAAEPEVAKVISNLQSHMSSNPNSIAQKAATEALNGPQGSIELMRRAFEARRDYFTERVAKIDGVEIIPPDGAFYVMMDVSAYFGKTLGGVEIHDADDFADAFLSAGHVALVPCTGFGAPNHVRWSYATSLENIKLGIDRLEKFLEG